MFKTEVDLSSLSARATIRWKRENQIETDRQITKPDHRRIRSLISSSDPSKFLTTSLNSTEEFTKVSKQEDLKEVSLQLSILRKKHDFNKESNFHHDADLLRLKRKIDNFGQEENKTVSTIFELKQEVDKLEKSIIEVTEKQEEAWSAGNVYRHILERMRKARVFLDIKNEDISKEARTNSKSLEEEVEILRKVKESKIKTRAAHDLLVEYKEKVTVEKKGKLLAISKDVLKRQEYNKKREDRHKRQLEIAEAAANEHRDMSDQQMRESLIAHRFWFLYLEKRLSHDRKKFSPTERAFEKVRKIAGINDASEMVTKFLTAEFAFNDLKRAVDDTSARIDETETNIEEIEDKIFNMERLKIQTSTIESIKNDMIVKLKVISNDKEKLMKIKCLHDKIKAWGSKNLKKFGILSKSNTLDAHALAIRSCVVGILRKVKKIVKNS
jgi:hypothetical protein